MIYIKSGKEGVFQCMHGGFNQEYDPRKLIKSSNEFEKIKVNDISGFNWGDFKIVDDPNKIECFNRLIKSNLCFDTEKYLSNFNVTAIFRGHQDKCMGFKMFPSSAIVSEIKKNLKSEKLSFKFLEKNDCSNSVLSLLKHTLEIPEQYSQSLGGHLFVPEDLELISSFNKEKKISDLKFQLLSAFKNTMNPYLNDFIWYFKDALSDVDWSVEKGISLKFCRPIFTFTTSVETQNVFCDFFAVLELNETASESLIFPFEFQYLPSSSQVPWYKVSDKYGSTTPLRIFPSNLKKNQTSFEFSYSQN